MKKLPPEELLQEILACLRVNLMRETLTTENDKQFERFLDAWGRGESAIRKD